MLLAGTGVCRSPRSTRSSRATATSSTSSRRRMRGKLSTMREDADLLSSARDITESMINFFLGTHGGFFYRNTYSDFFDTEHLIVLCDSALCVFFFGVQMVAVKQLMGAVYFLNMSGVCPCWWCKCMIFFPCSIKTFCQMMF